MTTRKLMERISSIISEAEYKAYASRIDGWDRDEYGNPIYEDGYGEASFPIKLTQRQAEEISDFLSELGYDYWFYEPIVVNPKAVYRLWVSFLAVTTRDCNDRWWGVYRVTESPADTTSGPCRRVRERK